MNVSHYLVGVLTDNRCPVQKHAALSECIEPVDPGNRRFIVNLVISG